MESPLNNDPKVTARKEVKRVLADERLASLVTDELDTSTLKLEMKRAKISTVVEANLESIKEQDMPDSEREQLEAKQRQLLDQAEIELENHVDWRVFIKNTFNI